MGWRQTFEILLVISDCLPAMDKLCKMSIKFTNSCVVSECAMVSRLVRSGLSVGRMCYGESVSQVWLVSWQNELDSGSECSFLYNPVRIGYLWCRTGNIDISCMRIFYETLVSVELGLKVHLILEAILIRDCVMTSDAPWSCDGVRRSVIVWWRQTVRDRVMTSDGQWSCHDVRQFCGTWIEGLFNPWSNYGSWSCDHVIRLWFARHNWFNKLFK